MNFLFSHEMTVSDDIFRLIRSLSKNEKAYFRKFAQLHVLGGENAYVKLFDEIELQEYYDEKKLSAKFSKGKSSSQFSVLKNYLYNLVLKALRNYHAEDTLRAELRQQLQNISILFERGLHEQAQKLLRRCRKQAEENELFRELIEISALEQTYMIFGKTIDEKVIEAVNANLEERALIIRKMQNTHDYDKLEYNLAFHLRNKTKSSLTEAEKIINCEMLKDEKHALCVVSRLKFHHIHATYFYYTGKTKECLDRLLREILILEENPSIMKLRSQDYVLLNNNVLLMMSAANDFKNFDKRISEFRKKMNEIVVSPRLFEQALAHNYLVEMERYYVVSDFSKLMNASRQLENELASLKVTLNTQDELMYCDLLCRAAAKQGNFKEALKYSSKLLNNPLAETKFGEYLLARLLNLIIHFELGNFDYLDYAVQSFSRQVMKKDKRDLFVTIVSFLKKFPNAKDEKERESIRKYYAEILKKEAQGANKKYFDFSGWLASEKQISESA